MARSKFNDRCLVFDINREGMREGRASITAQRVAERRAAHQLFDNPKVFDDPVALRYHRRRSRRQIDALTPATAQTPVSRGLRAFMAVRSRYAEDQLRGSLKARRDAVRDSWRRAGHLRLSQSLSRHCAFSKWIIPATQAWKRSRLEAAGIPVPANLTFTPVDFERETFEQGLAQEDLTDRRAAFFSWLGVTPYLRREIVLNTFERIAALCPENGVAFDYAVPRESLGMLQEIAFDAIAKRGGGGGRTFRRFFRNR